MERKRYEEEEVGVWMFKCCRVSLEWSGNRDVGWFVRGFGMLWHPDRGIRSYASAKFQMVEC